MRLAKAASGRNLPILLLVLLAIAAGTFALRFVSSKPAVPHAMNAASITVELPPSNLLRPISPQQALQVNEDRSFSLRKDSPAAAFKFAGDSATKKRALECLAQAVYYEAAVDGPDAERAVAQVVLNRVRHPGYPPSICGVVYEGSQSPGCQFTFTCDGSLARAPAAFLWRQAQEIAKEGLGGKVFGPVGHATHYHADYVLPYWADSLDKSVQIGQQIFYRLKGVSGDAAAFTQRYGRQEPLPPPPPSTIIALPGSTADATSPPAVEPDNHNLINVPVPALTQGNPNLLADSAKPVLIADANAGVVPGNHKNPTSHANDRPCPPTQAPLEDRLLSANTVRNGPQGACP